MKSVEVVSCFRLDLRNFEFFPGDPFVNKTKNYIYYILEHYYMEGKAIIEAYKKFAASKGEDNELFAPYRTKLSKCIISYDMAIKSPESV